MKVVTLTNQKGGVGKSTIAIHLAHLLVKNNKRVVFVDLDGQCDSSTNLAQFASEEQTAVCLFDNDFNHQSVDANLLLIPATAQITRVDTASSGKAVSNFVHNIKTSFNEFDFCVIDTAPSISIRLVAALTASDFALSPIELSDFSLAGLKKTMQAIFGVKAKYNKSLVFLGMLPNRVNTRANSHKKALRDILKAYPDYTIKAFISNRTPISDALDKKIPVWELKSGNAKTASKEIIKVLTNIQTQMEKKPNGYRPN
ncbi:MAG: ParA family protein [Methylococcales bacterium]